MRSPRLVGVAVSLSLLLTSLDGTRQRETPRPISDPIWSGKSAPPDTSRLALVIGNSAYPDADSPLPIITRNAEGLTNALREHGFLVDAIENATGSDMTHAVDHLRARVHSNSTVLVYFGGYGIQSDGHNYLIPVDAKIWSEEDIRLQGLSIDHLLSQLQTSGARVRLLVMRLRAATLTSDASGLIHMGLRPFKEVRMR
ncbi:caspase family protein [Bradyrhizobium zhanjiangense]|uniref:caspase family protein n=1 Tax=Bradyrhizobium zhanjiangense TaxID=1325107 RepID=UPI0010088683